MILLMDDSSVSGLLG